MLGVLVGTIDKANKSIVSIVDSFPLFHTPITAPSTEIAFELVN